MPFIVNEIFYSFQGEGARVGRPAVFCRFAGCNLWSGREEDRAFAICKFCDTDFTGIRETGGVFEHEETLAKRILDSFPPEARHYGVPYVIFTGGEPALQLTASLLSHLHRHGLEIGIETNGTIELPTGLDWICVSPKANAQLLVKQGNELKLVWPQAGLDPQQFAQLDFTSHILQPCATGDKLIDAANLDTTMRYCLHNPLWRLGIQLHKLLDFP